MRFTTLIVTLCVLLFAAGTQAKVIKLTNNNFVVLRDQIDSINAANVVDQLSRFWDKDEVYLFLDTPGGSVSAGLEITNYIRTLEMNGVNVVCIANRAFSMGFVIMQYCPTRYVMDSSIMMQHQMSLGVQGPLKNVQAHMNFIHSLNNQVESVESSRLGLSLDTFRDKVQHDWWLYGNDIIANNVADEIVNVICAFDSKPVKKTIYTFFGDVELVYSSCPLASAPLSVAFREANMTQKEIEQLFNPIEMLENIRQNPMF